MSKIARILDGKLLAGELQLEIAARVKELSPKAGRVPGLGVILVGDNPASKTYVASKEKYAKSCGFNTFDQLLPENATYEQVLGAIKKFNADPAVDGILLQLPLPKHLDSNRLLLEIDPAKDADGLHPFNQGLLMRGEGHLRPCTPLGVMRLLDTAMESKGRADLAGKKVIIVGRSILVGKPVAQMFLERNATVTMAHSKTTDLPAECRAADIVVAAVGVPKLVKRDWIEDGAIVLDVGINRGADGKLCGDVDFADVSSKCSAITPVPGGVGPMTIAMLMKNTLQSYEARHR